MDYDSEKAPDFKFVRPDTFVALRFQVGGELREYAVTPKYDRIDHWPRLNAWAIKIYDDEDGLMSVYTYEDEALRVADVCELPVVPRDFMTESEHEAWITSQTNNLDEKDYGL